MGGILNLLKSNLWMGEIFYFVDWWNSKFL